MSDAFTRFVRSNAIYSKTVGCVHVAAHNNEVFLFINGMPLRHGHFLHYAVAAVHPSAMRPEHVESDMNEEAGDLLPRVGVDLSEIEGEGGYARYVSRKIREYVKADESDIKFTTAVMDLINEIETKASAFDPLLSVRDLDDYVIA